jgi:Ankyrin repeats (many copies)/Ankyrin repeats (3 copies)
MALEIAPNGYDWSDPENYTASWLIQHAEAGRTPQVMMALDRGVCINGKGPKGETALTQAVLRGRVETAFALLDRGADILIRADQGDTVLHKAYAWEPKDIHLLIDRGADVNAKNETDTTPIMTVMNEHQARALLERGADPNAVHENGQTPLMNASWGRNRAMCIVLAEYGADPNARNHRQQSGTALHRAMLKNDTDMGALLVALGARPSLRNAGRNDEWRSLMAMPRLHAAARCGQTQLALSLVSSPEDLEKKHRRKTADQIAKEVRFHDTAAALQSLRAQMAIDVIQFGIAGHAKRKRLSPL